MLTNAKFAKEDKEFIKACSKVETGTNPDGTPKTLPPTTRQASKYRNQKGSAYKLKNR